MSLGFSEVFFKNFRRVRVPPPAILFHFVQIYKNEKMKIKDTAKKTWHFIWNSNSIWSWIVNVILAFVLIKFIVYPGLGLLLGTNFPVVAVVSNSMEHDSSNFELWWEYNKAFYINRNITKEEFGEYAFHNGFNKGDIMILRGYNPENIETGDIIVFRAGKAYPIIHRVVEKNNYFETKGDNNPDQIISFDLDETNIQYEQLIGKAVFRIPWVGYVKIGAVELVSSLKG